MVLPSTALNTNCPGTGAGTPYGASDLNYLAIVLAELGAAATVKRTVTNVGLLRDEVYHATIVSSKGARVAVWPPALTFSPRSGRAGCTEYYVTVTPAKLSRGWYDFGEIVWSDGSHRARRTSSGSPTCLTPALSPWMTTGLLIIHSLHNIKKLLNIKGFHRTLKMSSFDRRIRMDPFFFLTEIRNSV
ncbi:hypothetical protein QYE76_062029 [Lolium multiflorum]|uniref:Subtilisin-like protease fibronectin type-III domain-containing protein n=1 Tax=Lolium multiflorum TaxID=4521 RepID=A0AAD8W7S5_LOLMU|nr:hypothetical protein QYE76_062029 [Lolium multiflorum]